MLEQKQIDELKNFFVDSYDNISKAKDQINDSFKIYQIDFQYDYDSFCKDFLSIVDEFNIDYSKIGEVVVVAFVISKMIVSKLPPEKVDQIKETEEFKEIRKRFDF